MTSDDHTGNGNHTANDSANSTHFLLDCDPGIDDAFALFCALKYGNLDVVTTVSGNVAVEDTTRNALYLLELAGADVPVHRGAAKPLVFPPVAADDIHGTSGFGEFQPPDPQRAPELTTAVEAILDYCKHGGATLVATGPLTNIAQAIQADPTISERIENLFWMGGGTTKGNVTAQAEFNAWCDPDAVAITLESGIPVTMFDLDLTHQVRMGETEIQRLRESETPTAQIFADALDFYQEAGSSETVGQPMHDPCAILGFLRPDHFEFRGSNIVCETSNDDERGKTVVNFSSDTLDHRVAITANDKEVIELILMAIIELGGNS